MIDTEYLLRRYNKIILMWINEQDKDKSLDLKTFQNQLTQFILRYQQYVTTERVSVEKYFNFLEQTPYPILKDALSAGQFESKAWLREELLANLGPKKLGQTLILGGWVGLLGPILFQRESGLGIERIFSMDKDPNCTRYADLLNTPWLIQDWKYKAFCADATQMDYSHLIATTTQLIDNERKEIDFEIDPLDTIINTSCEHFPLESWLSSVKKGTLLILQSNNFHDHPEHTSTHKDLESFQKDANLSKVIYAAEKALPKYKRFLLIGQK